MRPGILNPLCAALTDLKGVGPQLAKPLTRLGLERVVDVLFHLPTGLISHFPVERLDQAQAGQTIIVELTAQDYRPGRSPRAPRSEEHTSELQSLMRISYAVFCLKKKKTKSPKKSTYNYTEKTIKKTTTQNKKQKHHKSH